MAITTRRAKYKENAADTKEILEDTTVHLLETGGGCPSLIEQAYQEALDQEARTLKMFAKAQEQVRKSIKLRLDEILESIDPKNMGKSRKVFVRNPDFNRREDRTDSDTNRCEGDNPLWCVDYQELYSPMRFKESTVTKLMEMARGENKDIVKELKEAKKKLREAQKEAREMKDALKDVADNKVEDGEESKDKSLMGNEWFN